MGAALRTTVEDLLGRLRGLISSQLARRERLSEDALAGYLSAWATPAAMGAFFQLVHQVGAADLLGRTSLELGSSRVPTLLLWGELDEITPVEEGRRLARSLPASSLEVIPEAGHLLPEEAPEALARAVRSFLRRTPRKY
ncbi:MAG: alpha/beta hydrolase [Deltaproteobacteria bacterium]|nr:alpha/beta hydrolase [Deltaproteobacteria bacterium]